MSKPDQPKRTPAPALNPALANAFSAETLERVRREAGLVPKQPPPALTSAALKELGPDSPCGARNMPGRVVSMRPTHPGAAQPMHARPPRVWTSGEYVFKGIQPYADQAAREAGIDLAGDKNSPLQVLKRSASFVSAGDQLSLASRAQTRELAQIHVNNAYEMMRLPLAVASGFFTALEEVCTALGLEEPGTTAEASE